MKFLKKICKYLGNLTKPKCPNCKSRKLKHLEKKFLNTGLKSSYDFNPRHDNGSRQPNFTGYHKYEIYYIKYQCSDCDYIFNKTEKDGL